MSTVLSLVRRNAYVDSITLLQVSAEVSGLSGVEDAALVMATDLNRDLLRESGLLVADGVSAGPNDLVISVRAQDEAKARAAIERAEALLAGRGGETRATEAPPRRSLRSAHRAEPEAQLAVISVPGPFAAAEAYQALAEGLNVFLFSDNVSLDDEVELKKTARGRGLLVMGPDCGTAIINGVGLGFANVVRRGSIGLVGASGTGIQEVVSLVHRAGLGISHAIGTGSRDLHAEVGGITTLQALELLAADPSTHTIVLVSKPSDDAVAVRVLEALRATGKRAVAYLQGSNVSAPEGVVTARNLAEAAALATEGEVEVAPVQPNRPILGLFCGGTLAQEAALTLGESVQVIDFGDDQYTRGRAHPMIDPTLRNQAIAHASAGVVLLDFILGLSAHPDPVGAALPAIRSARDVAFVAHVVGTDLDPQGLAAQEDALRAAGVLVCPSNYAAAVAAANA